MYLSFATAANIFVAVLLPVSVAVVVWLLYFTSYLLFVAFWAIYLAIVYFTFFLGIFSFDFMFHFLSGCVRFGLKPF